MNQSSTDAATQQFMARISDLERNRRVLMMQRQQAETKLAIANDEHERLKKEIDFLSDREGTLKRNLRALTDEQRQLQLREEQAQQRLLSAEHEEPLLTQAASQTLQESTKLHSLWAEEITHFRASAAKWNVDDTCANNSRLSCNLDALKQEITVLNEKEARLQQMIVTLNAPPPAGTLTAAPTEYNALALADLEAKIESIFKQMEDADTQSARQKAIIGREIKELSSRCADIDQWIGDLNATADELKASIAQMDEALRLGQCASCASKKFQ